MQASQSTTFIPRAEWDEQVYEAIEAHGVTRSDAQAIADADPDKLDTLFWAATWPKDAADAIMGKPAPSPIAQFEANVEAGIPAAVVIRPADVAEPNATTGFRDTASGTYYPSQESVDSYLPKGRSVVDIATGKVYTPNAADTHEYLFDVKLFAAIRVKAKSEAEARAMLDKVLDCADTNFGSWPDGSPILGEVSTDDDGADLVEIDGEAV